MSPEQKSYKLWTLSSPEFQDLFDAIKNVRGYAIGELSERLRQARDESCIFFIGNGGSAAIASHMASDWQKAGRFKARCFSDGAELTCLANDYGYENAYRVALSNWAKPRDVLFAVSSSGESLNICNAAEWAKQAGMYVVTVSGFRPDNRLRSLGNVNVYVSSMSYGIVEVAHHAVLHNLLDKMAKM